MAKPTTKDYIESILVSLQDIKSRLKKYPFLDSKEIAKDARRIDKEMGDLRDSLFE